LNKVEVYLNNILGALALTPNNLAAFEYTTYFFNTGVSISPFYLPMQTGVFIGKRENYLPLNLAGGYYPHCGI
jgi:serine/threonine-protein kinase HipA